MGLIGVDIAPQWQIVQDWGLFNVRSDFVLVRLKNGRWLEPTFDQYWNKITSRKAPYLNLKWNESIPDQVNEFYSDVQQHCPDYSLPVMFDIESLLLLAGMLSSAYGFAKNLFGNNPMPYSSQYYWKNSYPLLPGIPKFVANYPNSLQNLNYSGAEAKFLTAIGNGFPSLPTTWPDWDFWQGSKTGIGLDWGLKYPDSKSIDVDYFRGTYQDLDNMFAAWKGDPIPPTPPPTLPTEIVPLKTVRVTADALNIRSVPDSSDPTTDIGTLIKNSDVPVVQDLGNWYRIDGYIYKPLTQEI
jgi:hypothetical protein